MENRIPASGQEGRVYIVPENGEPFYATITMADGATVLGTAWNKENVLQDPTCEKLGIPTTAVPNDAFLACSGRIILDNAYTSITQDQTYPAPDLSYARQYLAGATAGRGGEEHAVFAGGQSSVTTVGLRADAYDAALTHTNPSNQSVNVAQQAGTDIGEYAIFGGGVNQNGSYIAIVNAYDGALTQSNPENLAAPVNEHAAASNGAYAIFAGGRRTNNIIEDAVTAYDDTLTRVTPQALSVARYNLSAARAGEYAVFSVGTASSGGTRNYDAFDAALTRTGFTPSFGNLPNFGAATSTHAVFPTSRPDPTLTYVVDDSLTGQTLDGFNFLNNVNGAAGSAFGHAVFSASNTVYAYDDALTLTTVSNVLPNNIQSNAMAAVGELLVIAGGSIPGNQGGQQATAVAYAPGTQYALDITIPPWVTYSINGEAPVLATEETQLSLRSAAPYSGYITPQLRTLTGQI